MEMNREKKREEFGPLILITGEEEFLVAEWVKKIKDRLVDPGLEEFNYNLFDGSGLVIGDLLNLAQTFPILSERRLIVVRESDEIPARELDKLNAYLDDPLPSTCLVFVAFKADMRKGFFIRLKEKGRVITCQKLYENQVAPWIRARFREASAEIEEDAVLFLKTEIGPDLLKLSAEIEKILSFVGDRKKVTYTDCEVLIRGGRKYSRFELINQVGNRDQARALNLLSSILAEGDQPLVILAMLARNFRNLMRLGELKKSGLSKTEVSKKLGIPEFYLSETYRHYAKYSSEEIRNSFLLFLEADLQLKGNLRPAERTLEALIMDLCSGETIYTVPAFSVR